MSAVFDIELLAPDGVQRRYSTVAAKDEDGAREQALAKEFKAVEFTLEIPDKSDWERGRFVGPDGGAILDFSSWDAYDPQWASWAAQLSYEEARSANKKRLEEYFGRLDLKNGKVRTTRIGRMTTGRLLNHMQDAPYEIVGITQVDPAQIDRERLVRRFAEELREVDPRHDPNGWERIIDKLREDGFHTAAVTAQIHGAGISAHDSGASPIVWGTGTAGDDIFVTLHSGLTADVDTQDFFNDVSGSEATGTNWASGGVELAGKAWNYDTATNQTRGDASDISVSTVTVSATDAVIRKSTGTASTSPIIGSIDFGATVSATAGTWAMTWDATGIVVRTY